MSTTSPTYPTDDTVQVRRGRVDSVDLYEVKEYELSILESGDANSIYFNFSVFLLSISFSAILALSTSTFKKPVYETVAIVIAVVGVLGGLFLILLWWKGRKKVKTIITTIKNRINSQYVIVDSEQAPKDLK